MAVSCAVVAWVEAVTASRVVGEVFVHEHLSMVAGLRLEDGRTVVVKARPGVERAAVCVAGQAALHAEGFPCPQPLSDVGAVEGLAVHLEEYVPADRKASRSVAVCEQMAGLLADLTIRSIRLGLSGPRPSPMWLAWDHPAGAVWPDEPVEQPPVWLTEVAAACRARMHGVSAVLGEVVVHGDWEVQNMGWRDGRVVVVHDWDSLAAGPEAALVGAAAATFSSGAVQPVLSSLDEADRFLAAYQAARRRPFSVEEIEVAWAAGTWLAAHNARMEIRHSQAPLVLQALSADHTERLRRAGA